MLWKHHHMVEIFNLPSTPFAKPPTNDPRCSERPLAGGEILTEVGGEISTKPPTEGGFLMHPKKPETLWSVLVDWFREAVKPLRKNHKTSLATAMHFTYLNLISFITPRLFFERQLEREMNHVSHLCLSHHGAWQHQTGNLPYRNIKLSSMRSHSPNNEHTIVQPTSKHIYLYISGTFQGVRFTKG